MHNDKPAGQATDTFALMARVAALSTQRDAINASVQAMIAQNAQDAQNGMPIRHGDEYFWGHAEDLRQIAERQHAIADLLESEA